jgi:regulatory protein YycI of two-component signal transduction system YycFG
MRAKLNQNQLSNIEETLEDFKALLPRYRSLKDDETKSKQFFVRNRNPVWDITNCKFFRTGLMSEDAKDLPLTQLVDDHYIQRSKAMKFIFSELDKDESMSFDKFTMLLKKYCSTVKLSKDEHSMVTALAKKNPTYLNYESYLACKIQVDGLSDLMLN